MAHQSSRVIADAKLTGRARAEEILAALPCAILTVDERGIIDSANAAAEMLLNVSAAQLHGARLESEISLPDRYDPYGESAFAAFDAALETPRGRRFRADLQIVPLGDKADWRMIVMTETAAAHRVGDRVDRASGGRTAVRIAAMLAHEIKNPLSGIRGAAQLLQNDQDETSRALTGLITQEVDRVAALIDRMEGFTDNRPIPPSAENIHSIIDHARSVAESGFARGVPFRLTYDPSLPQVMVHRDSMIQVILNLIKNAVEATESHKNSEIEITTAYRQGVSLMAYGGTSPSPLPIELCIIDSGPGAPMEIAESLFDPFISTKATGRGLGLALVDKLVRDMGGLIQYAREGKPERTVFRLLLPRARSHRA
jgi:two-component system, NtrC family, nitrogen regulation sensor histidine kinase GlnL